MNKKIMILVCTLVIALFLVGCGETLTTEEKIKIGK